MKNAQARSTLVNYIILIVGMIALLTIFTTVFSVAGESSRENICRTTVLATEKISFDTILTGAIRPISEVCFTSNEGRLRGNREQVKRQIADLAQRCWYQYAEGQVEGVFGKVEGEQGRNCGICYFFNIPGNMDLGTESSNKLFEEFERTDYNISAAELYNFLASTQRSTGLLYGGGSSNYIGDRLIHQGYQLDLENPRAIRRNQITLDENNIYLRDFTDYLTEETKNKIRTIGDELLFSRKANLLVVVAEELHDTSRSGARRLIESLELNTPGRYDSLVILIDLRNQIIRLHAGADLQSYFLEYEIEGILETNFGSEFRTFSDLNPSIIKLIKALLDKINSPSSLSEELNIQGTYLQYLTNDMETVFIPSDIFAGRTYAVAFMADPPKSWIERHGSTVGLALLGTSLVATTTAITGGGAAPFWAAVLTASSGSGIFVASLKESEQKNYLIIDEANALREICNVHNTR
ncbi:MAG: hypothetical protein ACMXX7_01230 [Candidatus Woesearchaeota archaeon]